MGSFLKLSLIFAFSCALVGVVVGDKIAIYHWNDVNGQVQRFVNQPFDSSSSPIPCDSSNSSVNCVGGVDGLDRLMNITPTGIAPNKVFRVCSGNLVGGENGWLSVLGWDTYGKLVKEFYKPHVMTYGIKEFESGLNRTLQYHHQHNHTGILLSNAKCRPTPIGTDEKLLCSHVLQVVPLEGTSVGVLGFVTPNVVKLSSPGDLEFEDIVSSLNGVVKDNPQYKSFIAVGDGSLDIAKDIVDKVPKVKVVIYGRALAPSKDMGGGANNYPLKYNNGYIATAARYGATLGQLVLDIDDTTGALTVDTAASKLIPVTNPHIPPQTILDYAANVSRANEIKVGAAVFDLEGGERCWRDECNLGNLVADSMVHCAYNNQKEGSSLITQPIVAIWQGGSLFRDTIKGGGKIGKVDIHRWLPYHNNAHLVKVKGGRLWSVFEASALAITANITTGVNDWGQFLQVSNGLSVYYKSEGGKAPQLVGIRTLHEEEGKPVMKDLEMDKYYLVVIPSFIKEGRNVYTFAKTFWEPLVAGASTYIGFDDDCVEGYIRGMGYVTVGFEERIWINAKDYDDPGSPTTTKGTSTFLTVVLTIVFMSIILGIVYVGYFYVIPRITGRHPSGFRREEFEG